MQNTLTVFQSLKWAAYGILVGCAFSVVTTSSLEILLEIWFPTVVGSTRLSYGQEFAMVSLYGCCLLGAVNGWAIAYGARQQPIHPPLILGAIAILGGITLLALYNMQMARYGPDRAQIIVYAPPFAFCVMSACNATVLAIRSLVVRAA